MGGFSSLVVSQIPSLKFSAFPFGLGIDEQQVNFQLINIRIYTTSKAVEITLREKCPQSDFLTGDYKLEWLYFLGLK
jgi:hypothetical protein